MIYQNEDSQLIPKEKAKELIEEWGLFCAKVEVWEMKTFNMPPSIEYWEEVEKQIQGIINNAIDKNEL